jgi:hypothetical protein
MGRSSCRSRARRTSTDGSGSGSVYVNGDGAPQGASATEEAFVQQRDPLPDVMLPSLISLMRMTQEAWDKWTRGSAIRRGRSALPGP